MVVVDTAGDEVVEVVATGGKVLEAECDAPHPASIRQQATIPIAPTRFHLLYIPAIGTRSLYVKLCRSLSGESSRRLHYVVPLAPCRTIRMRTTSLILAAAHAVYRNPSRKTQYTRKIILPLVEDHSRVFSPSAPENRPRSGCLLRRIRTSDLGRFSWCRTR